MFSSSLHENSFVAVDATLEDIKSHLRNTSYPLYSLKSDISYGTDILGISSTSEEENEVRTATPTTTTTTTT